MASMWLQSSVAAGTASTSVHVDVFASITSMCLSVLQHMQHTHHLLCCGCRSHKGSNLALMVELLAGPLVGAAVADKLEERNWGNLVLVIDPSLLGEPDVIKARTQVSKHLWSLLLGAAEGLWAVVAALGWIGENFDLKRKQQTDTQCGWLMLGPMALSQCLCSYQLPSAHYGKTDVCTDVCAGHRRWCWTV